MSDASGGVDPNGDTERPAPTEFDPGYGDSGGGPAIPGPPIVPQFPDPPEGGYPEVPSAIVSAAIAVGVAAGAAAAVVAAPAVAGAAAAAAAAAYVIRSSEEPPRMLAMDEEPQPGDDEPV
jgi:hypothetical protein